jgi:hypothetical protein
VDTIQNRVGLVSPRISRRITFAGSVSASTATTRLRPRSVSEPIVLISESWTAVRTMRQRAGPQRRSPRKNRNTDIVSTSEGQLRRASEGLIVPLAILRFTAARETRMSFACTRASVLCLPPAVAVDARGGHASSSCSPVRCARLGCIV